ncbi:hypothetical protein E0Z10_g563 [Xylaria hypoxylon]|uniref:UVI-1 protein n=1 Tax=Xylaria hypoxylon TaxID=37992 RepID=A0A4Z0Z9E2_9PEZI|nr:hypothetical protein E0Z10_g563 [Xylaria hypoxylon]
MQFSKILAGIAMASSAMAALSPQQIADGIKSVTAKSQALQAPAQSITALNAALIIVGQGPFPPLIAGFQDIVSTGNTLITQLGGTGPITKRDEKEHPRDLSPRGPDADLVFGAFREFVAVHQALLNILIGKAGLLEKIPVIGEPVATVLRAVEGVVDTIAIDLISITQARANDLTSDANSLDNSLQLAISKYDSISTGL